MDVSESQVEVLYEFIGLNILTIIQLLILMNLFLLFFQLLYFMEHILN